MAVGIGRNGNSVSSFWLFTLLQKCRLIVCLSVRPQDKLATCPGCSWGSWDRVRVQQTQVWKMNEKACRSENQACCSQADLKKDVRKIHETYSGWKR